MAFFEDLWKDITDTVGEAQCGLGFHDGTWRYTYAGDCEQKRVCTRNRCNDASYRTSHEDWGDWQYFKQQSCLQERFCKRCNHQEEKIYHSSWTEWEYVEERDCLQSRECIRCSETDTRTKHKYRDEKYYTYLHSCEVHELCKRCGDKNDLNLEVHKWSVIKHPTIHNKYQRYCTQCHKYEDIETS